MKARNMFRFLFAALLIGTPLHADPSFQQGDDPAVRFYVGTPDDQVMVYVRDMRAEVTAYVLCPDPETLIRNRLSIWQGDMDALAVGLNGHGCFIANAGQGKLTAVHINRLVQVEFSWLAGLDFDTLTDERLENSDRRYWVFSTQAGILPSNARLEPLIDAAFH